MFLWGSASAKRLKVTAIGVLFTDVTYEFPGLASFRFVALH